MPLLELQRAFFGSKTLYPLLIRRLISGCCQLAGRGMPPVLGLLDQQAPLPTPAQEPSDVAGSSYLHRAVAAQQRGADALHADQQRVLASVGLTTAAFDLLLLQYDLTEARLDHPSPVELLRMHLAALCRLMTWERIKLLHELLALLLTDTDGLPERLQLVADSALVGILGLPEDPGVPDPVTTREATQLLIRGLFHTAPPWELGAANVAAEAKVGTLELTGGMPWPAPEPFPLSSGRLQELSVHFEAVLESLCHLCDQAVVLGIIPVTWLPAQLAEIAPHEIWARASGVFLDILSELDSLHMLIGPQRASGDTTVPVDGPFGVAASPEIAHRVLELHRSCTVLLQLAAVQPAVLPWIKASYAEDVRYRFTQIADRLKEEAAKSSSSPVVARPLHLAGLEFFLPRVAAAADAIRDRCLAARSQEPPRAPDISCQWW